MNTITLSISDSLNALRLARLINQAAQVMGLDVNASSDDDGVIVRHDEAWSVILRLLSEVSATSYTGHTV